MALSRRLYRELSKSQADVHLIEVWEFALRLTWQDRDRILSQNFQFETQEQADAWEQWSADHGFVFEFDECRRTSYNEAWLGENSIKARNERWRAERNV